MNGVGDWFLRAETWRIPENRLKKVHYPEDQRPQDGKERVSYNKKDPMYQSTVPYSFQVGYILPPQLFENFTKTVSDGTQVKDALLESLQNEGVGAWSSDFSVLKSIVPDRSITLPRPSSTDPCDPTSITPTQMAAAQMTASNIFTAYSW